MNTTFKLDGCYELEIRSDGHVEDADGNGGAFSKGCVGFQLHYTPMVVRTDEDHAPRTVASMLLKRNQARAIASAMLCAVSEAE